MELAQEVESVPFFAQKGKINWQTPPEVIESAREALGSILLDPCAGVDTGHAAYNVCLPEDGLRTDWASFVPRGLTPTFFENPPFGTSYVQGASCLSAKEYDVAKKAGTLTGEWRRQTLLDWAKKTAEEVERGWEGIWLSKAALETQGLQRLLRVANGICFPARRINYVDAATGKIQKGVNFSSVILYFGTNGKGFERVFEESLGYTISW